MRRRASSKRSVRVSTDVAAGDRVVMTFLPRCGDCAGCRTDGRLPCASGTRGQQRGHTRGRRHPPAPRGPARRSEPVHHHLGVSAFATHAVVSRTSVVPVDADVPAEIAALLGCAVLTGGGAVHQRRTPGPRRARHRRRTRRRRHGRPAGRGRPRPRGHRRRRGRGEAGPRARARRDRGAEPRRGGGAAASEPLSSSRRPAPPRAFETALALTAPRRHDRHRGAAGPRCPRQRLAAPAHRRGAHRHRQLPRLGRAEPRHPALRRAVAERAPAAGATRLSRIRLDDLDDAMDRLAAGGELRQLITFRPPRKDPS